MEFRELVTYLGAVANSDGPISGREKDLIRHILPDFGCPPDQAQALVGELPEPFNQIATTMTLRDRETALKLLRALLVISYCDGSFDQEELPFLGEVVQRFQVTGQELEVLKSQAFYFLRQDPPSIQIPEALKQGDEWDKVCEFAHRQYEIFRQEFHKRFQDEISRANSETCFLAMAVGPPSFDTKTTQDRFLQKNPDYLHLEDEKGLQLLRCEAEKVLRRRWEAAYASRCNLCYLEAPGKRRDSCPRCKGEYGEASRR